MVISPEELKLPGYVKYEVLEKNGIPYEEVSSLENAIPKLDVLYMTRIQQERFSSFEEYQRLKDTYVLTPEKMQLAKPDMSVLHPLPRVNEISVKIDDDPRACYFKQVLNGKYIRMALILKLLADKNSDNENLKEGEYVKNIKCNNPRCITSTEQELEHVFKLVDKEKGIYRCIYCETKVKI